MQSKLLNNTNDSMNLRFEIQSQSFKLRMESETLVSIDSKFTVVNISPRNVYF